MSECAITLMDNSEWTRNGDYVPTRFSAQTDAVNLLAGAKTQAHPENTVGVLTMAGKTPQVLVTPTQDLGRVLNCMTEIDVEGESNFSASVQIAQLALKHRQNKNQRQRVIIFVASPIREDKVRACARARVRACVHACVRPTPMHATSLQPCSEDRGTRMLAGGTVDACAHACMHACVHARMCCNSCPAHVWWWGGCSCSTCARGKAPQRTCLPGQAERTTRRAWTSPG